MALNFVQCLHKIVKDEVLAVNDVTQLAGFLKSEYFFRIQITKDEVVICAIQNNVFN